MHSMSILASVIQLAATCARRSVAELFNVRSRVARPSPKKRIANLGESNVRLEICLRHLHPHNTREAVACTNNARDHKAVSVRNERRKRMEGRLHVENVC